MNSQKKVENNPCKNNELNKNSVNSKLNYSNKTCISNLRQSIFTKNNKTVKPTPTSHIMNNNNTNCSNTNSYNKNFMKNKYKTTKNSPNRIFKKENPKSSKYLNERKNVNHNFLSNEKKNKKFNSKNMINNKTNYKKKRNNKIILLNKKPKKKVLIDEIFKNKLTQKMMKKSITTKNSNNNSINLSNNTYNNMQLNSSNIIIPRLKFNNYNKGNKYLKIREQIINNEDDNIDIKDSNNFINFSNYLNNSVLVKNINSCRQKDNIKKISFKNEKNILNKKNNYYGQTSKDFYIIKKYISSVLSNQPQRHQNPNFSKTKKYNTITNRKIMNKFENAKIFPLSNRKTNINNSKINKIDSNHNLINSKITNTRDFKIFVRYNFHGKNKNKTSNNTKYNSRKGSIDKNLKIDNKELKVKTVQPKAGQPIRLSSENNNNNIKGTSKSISTNNYSYQNSDIFNKSNNINSKKNEKDYKLIYNNFILNNQKIIHNNLNSKNKNKKVYSTKSSKEKINNKLIFHKKECLDKLFNKIKKKNSKYLTHNSSKEDFNNKKNLSFRLKTPRQIENNKKINVNKKDIMAIKNIKIMKNTPTPKNHLNYYSNNKINNNRILDRYSGSNSKIEINKKNTIKKIKELSKSNKINIVSHKKLENINEENNNDIKNNKLQQISELIKSKDLEIKIDKNKEKTDDKDKKKKKEPDKDLSDREEDISLLNYLNNNIDQPLSMNSDTNILNESFDSMHSTTKENNKYYNYSKSKDIISNYIKKYYSKYKKYPKTKMKFYKYGRLLGKGAYGKVNLCLHSLTGRLVAIKSINKSKITKERQRKKIKLETSIMKTLSDSNNIVKIFEKYETKRHICIVMEYICAGDLLTFIKKRSKLSEPVARFIFKQIILALQYIHSHNIIHRDIKLDNILIDLDNNIKICDFGVSKIIKKGDILVEQCGTPAYIAPEILKNRGYEGFGVDIWSAGVVLYAMLSGTVPFKGNDVKDLHKLIIEGKYKTIKNVSKEANHLVKCLLEVEPKNRIKIEDILVHPWMINVDLNSLKTQNLFTNAEHILLAKSNVDYSDINNKENMVENFNIKNLDSEEENLNYNIKTKSIILAPFNSSISSEENEDNLFTKEENDFNNKDLIIRNGIIKFSPKVRDLNRNYELDNNKEIDNGIIILTYDSEEKGKKEASPYDGSYNSKFHSKQFSPVGEFEKNNTHNKNKNTVTKIKNHINEKILEKMKNFGYDKEYIIKCLNNKEFNYATASYKLLNKYLVNN